MSDDYYEKIDKSAAEAQEKVREPIGTIDLTPSWETVVRIYLEVLASDGSGTDAKGLAWEEIMRCARLADLYVKEHKS